EDDRDVSAPGQAGEKDVELPLLEFHSTLQKTALGPCGDRSHRSCGTCKTYWTHHRKAPATTDPDGIRTRVAALKGPCPRPLDDGAGNGHCFGFSNGVKFVRLVTLRISATAITLLRSVATRRIVPEHRASK